MNCRLSLAFSFAILASAQQAFADGPRVDFNRQVRPILSDVCFKCHGPDEKERKAGLRLDSQEGLLGAGESGAKAVVPGKPTESELLRRLTAADPELKMPPPSSGKQLTEAQVDLFRRWIAEGAEYKQHWSFVAPVRPTPPAVKHEAAVGKALDRFVLARLEREGLAPAPLADKTTLIRRLTFDLTGLPPTVAEVDAFLADQSAEAYERLVDRLLASARFGEHQARYWLDLTRYGDTHGLHLDNERSLWKYRDWVIEAFNANLPFDQFTIEQLAGDLLPNPTLNQRIATGFNRCNVTTSEGGSIDDEVRVRYAVDRTETMATIFLGLTLGCSVCHDHKYDPVSQKEFYGLYAFFNSAADNAMDGNALSPPPILRAPTAEQTAQLAAFDQQLAELRQKIMTEVARVSAEYVDPQPQPAAAAAPSNEPREVVWIDDATPPGAQLQGDTPWEFVGAPAPVLSGQKSTRRQAPALSQHFFTGANPTLMLGEGDKLFAYCFLDPANPPKTVMLQFNDGNWEHRAFWGEDAIPFGAGDVPGHRRLGDLPKTGEWVRLEVDAERVGLKAGTGLNGWAFTQFGGLVHWDKAGLVTRTPQKQRPSFESLAEWDAYERVSPDKATPQPVKDALKVEPEKRTDAQKKTIRDHFLQFVGVKTKPQFDALQKQIDAVTKQRTDLDNSVAVTLVMADTPQPRDTFLLIRGQYDKRGEKVAVGVPAVFPPLAADAPRNRLGLARWLTDPAHPLFARVAVNRFWQQLFGRGIVKTAEDFGSQGEWPTHPELLDWLSVEFREGGWNTKQFLKLLVMSHTYRQTSHVAPELWQRDPENVLLARGPRFRLDAEAVRDSALFVSGLLSEKIGGRSVKPYQPSGLWEAVGFVGSNTRDFKRDSGEALYRRGLYTFWKRTSPPPSMMAFDAPSRENCVARRARTNTPLQALVLLNDEQYVEAARLLARRMMVDGGDTPEKRLTHGFRLATARTPRSNELEVLMKLYAQHRQRFQADADAATKLLSVGDSKTSEPLDKSDHAAFTLVANLLLNLDETITKE